MLLNLGIPFKNLDGTDMQPSDNTMAKQLASVLAGEAKAISPVKAYDWATALHNVGKIEVDRTDLEAIEKFVEASGFFVFAKAQIMNVISDLKSTKPEAKATK